MSKLPTRVSASGATLPGANLKGLLLGVLDALSSAGLQETNRSTLTTSTTLAIAQAGLVLVDCTSASVVLTLPASGSAADDVVYDIRRLDSVLANTLTVLPSGSDTLEGSATAQVVAPQTLLGVQLPAGSTTWRVLGTGATTPAAARAAISASASGFRNRIINGDMSVDQRNSGAALTLVAGAALAYTVDKHYGFCTGANATVQQIVASDGSNRLRFTGAAGCSGVGHGHRIEAANCRDFAGQTVTISMKLASSLATLAWALYYANTTDTFGTLASPTRTLIGSGNFATTGVEAVASAQVAVPLAATTGLELVLTSGALGAAQTLAIGSLQIESGAVPASALQFEPVDAGTQLIRCQRTYEVLRYSSTGYALVSSVLTGSVSYSTWSFHTVKRIAPALITAVTGAWSPGSPAVAGSSVDGAIFSNPSNYMYLSGTPGAIAATANCDL